MLAMAKNGKIGIRIPDHPLAFNLLTQINPLTATSANISGTPGARTISGIDSELLSSISTIIDGGETPGGKSTVVDVDESTILRKGSHYEEIKTLIEDNSSFPLE